MSQVRVRQIRLLKMIEPLAAMFVVVGALAWGWYLTLLVTSSWPFCLMLCGAQYETSNKNPVRLVILIKA